MKWVVIKLAALGAGVVFPYLGAALLLLDGRFHLFSSQETLERESPDWILLRYGAGRDGFSPVAHRVIALLVIGTTLTYLGLAAAQKWGSTPLGVGARAYQKFYRYLFMPVTLAIIFAAILLKNIVLRQEGGVAFT